MQFPIPTLGMVPHLGIMEDIPLGFETMLATFPLWLDTLLSYEEIHGVTSWLHKLMVQ